METIMTASFPSNILLDDMMIPAGPLARLLGAARDHLVDAAHARGVAVTVCTDFNELVSVNTREQRSGTWPYPMLPAADPRLRALTADNSFWLSGTNTRGDVVSVQAAVLEDAAGRSVGQRLQDLSAFYGERAAAAPQGEWCRCDSTEALNSTGRAVFSSTGWTRPDQRGLRLFPLFSRVSRLVSWVRWQPDLFWGVVQADAVEAWKESLMGPRHLDDTATITYHRAGFDTYSLRFLRFTPAQMLGDLAVLASAPTAVAA